MHWAKTQSRARFNLATSGVGSFPLAELPRLPALEINGDSKYGYAPLQQAIARKCGVDPDCVVAAAGTSMANHLAMATLIDPGDEVLIEHPAYELLVSAALFLGAQVKRFARAADNGYALDPAVVRRALTAKTKLIVVTNLHNPSGVLTPYAVLREVGDLARSVGAHVLVDEVYLDAVYENTPRTAFQLGPEFIVTNSLTKVYGLSGLRCGWILAQPDLARAMWRLNDLFASIPAHPAELLSVARAPGRGGRSRIARRIPGPAARGVRAAHHLGHNCVSALAWRGRGPTAGAAARGLRDYRGAGPLLRDAQSFPHRDGREYGDVRRGLAAARPGADRPTG
jgi:DNA-binding transcriptional MocR family regulator